MSARRLRRQRWLAGVAIAGLASLGATSQDLAQGDSAWERRAEGAAQDVARQAPVLAAVRAYGRALEADPESLEARWKLLRALHFAGDFTDAGEEQAAAFFRRACTVADEGLARLGARVGSDETLVELAPDALGARLASAGLAPRDAARFYFWSAINWGAWSRTVGLLSAVREGVANRIHRYTRIAVALEPDYEQGGPLRLLARLHAQLPRVPLFSGWVDRERALPIIESAIAIDSEDVGNRYLLAVTLLERDPDRRADALDLLDRAQRQSPRPFRRIEDLVVLRQVRERLAAERR